jgi:hypothetical protein
MEPTIASIARRMGSGSVGHAATSRDRSGSRGNASDSASCLDERVVFPADSDGSSVPDRVSETRDSSRVFLSIFNTFNQQDTFSKLLE